MCAVMALQQAIRMEQSGIIPGSDSAVIDSRESAASKPHQEKTPRICSTQSMEKTYDTVFLNAKAGMDGVDKQKVQKVVYEMSKGSKYFSNEQRKESIERQRIEVMRARAAILTQTQLNEHQKASDSKLVKLEATRDLSRVWVHVDMDAFYAAVETLVDPSLSGKPMAVGGMSMICTANYEARKFGVRAAMPGFIARKLCPDLIFVKPDFKKYTHFCGLSRQVFHEYDSNFIARSLDEAYLDITEICRLRNMTPADVAEEMRSKVHAATGLTCSAGVGPNRLLAKVCSDMKKPNGQFVLRHDRSAVMEFISSLPIRKVSGIGKVTERMLREVLGINICADLLTERARISALFSHISTDFFLSVGLGIGATEAPQHEHRKSLGHERTFSALSDERGLYQKLDDLAELLATDMAKEDLQGRTVTLKLKTTGFQVRTRAVSLPWFTNSKTEIMDAASKLLKAELPVSLRLMGLRINQFKLRNPEPAEHSQKTITSFISRAAMPFSSTSLDDVDHSEYFSDGQRNDSDCFYDNHELVCGPDQVDELLLHPKAALAQPKLEVTGSVPSLRRKRKKGQQTMRTFLCPKAPVHTVINIACKQQETSENGLCNARLEVGHLMSERPLPSGDQSTFAGEPCTVPVHETDRREQLPNETVTTRPMKIEINSRRIPTPSQNFFRAVDRQSRKSHGHRSKRRSDTPLEFFFARAKRSASGPDEKS